VVPGRVTDPPDAHQHATEVRQPRPRAAIALSIADPDDQYRFLEIRGTVEKIEDDGGRSSTAHCSAVTHGLPIKDADVGVSSLSVPTATSPCAAGPSSASKSDRPPSASVQDEAVTLPRY